MTDQVNTELLEEPKVDDVVAEEGQSEPDDQNDYQSTKLGKAFEREKKKAFDRGYDKAKREMLMQQQQEPQMQAPDAMQQEAPAQAPAPQSLGGMPQMSQEQIAQLISQQLPQHLQALMQEAQAKQEAASNQQMINGFIDKLRAAKDQHPGLEEELSNYDYRKGSGMTEIVMAANQLDNTADIMREVVDHPNKMANLVTLAKEQPYALNKAMQALSASIKRNQEAVAQEQQSQDPMSRLKPSPQAGADNGSMSVQDFRKMFSV